MLFIANEKLYIEPKKQNKQKVMCVCVCLSKYFLCASLLIQIVKTHTQPTHTHTDIKQPTGKTGTNVLCVCCIVVIVYMYTFSNFSMILKIFWFPATVQIKSRKMIPSKKLLYTDLLIIVFESPCLCSVV